MNKFYGKSYLYNGKIIGATQGLGENFIIAYYSPNGGKHRVRSYAKLKTYSSAQEAQLALDKFAAEHALIEA